jgi:hypothetical protein
MKVLLFSLAVLAALPASASFIVGLPADPTFGNCIPFGCAYQGEYQQVYTSSVFTGPITITGLSFFNTQSFSPATQMNSGTWTISLSTTSADWNSLSTTFAANIGTDNTVVFSGDLSQPWAFGDTLSIALSAPFTYNPAAGNLLMDVQVSGAANSGNSPIGFDVNGEVVANAIMGRVFTTQGGVGGNGVTNGFGLVTGFDTATSSVPEAPSALLLGAGLGLLGIANLVHRNCRA